MTSYVKFRRTYKFLLLHFNEKKMYNFLKEDLIDRN